MGPIAAAVVARGPCLGRLSTTEPLALHAEATIAPCDPNLGVLTAVRGVR